MLVKDFEHFPNHRDFAEPDADPIWCRGLFALKGKNLNKLLHPRNEIIF